MSTLHDINSDIRANSSSDLTDYVHRYPLTFLATTTVAGFVLGGGLETRAGRIALTLTVRWALQVFGTRMISGESHGE